MIGGNELVIWTFPAFLFPESCISFFVVAYLEFLCLRVVWVVVGCPCFCCALLSSKTNSYVIVFVLFFFLSQ